MGRVEGPRPRPRFRAISWPWLAPWAAHIRTRPVYAFRRSRISFEYSDVVQAVTLPSAHAGTTSSMSSSSKNTSGDKHEPLAQKTGASNPRRRCQLPLHS